MSKVQGILQSESPAGRLSRFTRRAFGRSVCAAGLLSSLPPNYLAALESLTPASQAPGERDPASVLRRLVDGNIRFAAGRSHSLGRTPKDFQPLAQGQSPIAVILGCADSRVSPEILFDLGIGDLFVVRVAGNYVSGAGSSIKGSIEYGVLELKASLIMVLGHSSCGAVKAAIKHIRDHDTLPGAIDDLVNNIKPAVLESEGKSGDLLANATRANVLRGVKRLEALNPVIGPAVKAGTVKVVGGVYNLDSGKVDLL